MTSQPFMPLFFGDLLAATPTWDGEERALYVLLLAYQWSSGPLPIEIPRLARMTQYDLEQFTRLWRTISGKFVVTDAGLVNMRLETHRQKSIEIGRKRSTAGATGAAKRWQKPSQADDKSDDKPNGKPIANATGLLCHPSHPIPSHPNPSESSQVDSSSPPSGSVVHPKSSVGHGAHDFEKMEREFQEMWSRIAIKYPTHTAKPDWLLAQGEARRSLERNHGDWRDLEAGVDRYVEYVRLGGVSGPQYVRSPLNFFKTDGWKDLWTPPQTKAEQRLDTNIDNAAEAKRQLAKEMGR